MNRVFMFAFQNCHGDCGGGCGVEYRLYLMNCKYKKLRDIYYIFKDRVVYDTEDCGSLAKMPWYSRKRLLINRLIPNFAFGMRKLWQIKWDERIYLKKLRQLDAEYHFDEDDVYIFHDMQWAYPFLMCYSFTKIMMICHSQGSYYNEWYASSGHKSNAVRQYYNRMYCKVIQKLRYIGFPSRGAEEAFLESEPALVEAMQRVKRRYLYNGVECPDIQLDALPEWIQTLRRSKGIKFATIARLNAAKAVERIPEYLGALKQSGYDFKWILIGQGIKGTEVQAAIERFQIQENTIWIQDFIAHETILQLLSVTDFYILFHRQSVFDLSTLEAMHYGNIPILSPVGGNIDILSEGTGVSVSVFSDLSDFEKLINQHLLCQLKEKNRKIQMQKYDGYSFYKRYVDICRELQMSSN